MYKKILLFAAVFGAAFSLSAQTDRPDGAFEKYEAEAVEQDKALVVMFGGNWCPHCAKFEKDVLKKKPFKDYMKESLIFLKVDPGKKGFDDFDKNFRAEKPRGKEAEKMLQKVADFKKHYGIKGVPNIWIYNKSEKKWKFLGRRPSAAEFVDAIRDFEAKNK